MRRTIIGTIVVIAVLVVGVWAWSGWRGNTNTARRPLRNKVVQNTLPKQQSRLGTTINSKNTTDNVNTKTANYPVKEDPSNNNGNNTVPGRSIHGSSVTGSGTTTGSTITGSGTTTGSNMTTGSGATKEKTTITAHGIITEKLGELPGTTNAGVTLPNGALSGTTGSTRLSGTTSGNTRATLPSGTTGTTIGNTGLIHPSGTTTGNTNLTQPSGTTTGTTGFTQPSGTTAGTASVPSSSRGIRSLVDVEEQILAAANAERAKVGLPPLTVNNTARKFAKEKSTEMIQLNYFSHKSPQRGYIQDIAKKSKWRYSALGENIYTMGGSETYILKTAKGTYIVKQWMNSPGHRANILNRKYKQIGIGVSLRDGKLMATQVFYTP